MSSNSIIVDNSTYLEVKCHFIQSKRTVKNEQGLDVEELSLTFIPSEMYESMSLDKDMLGEEGQTLSYVIGLFKKPNYKTYYIVKTKSISIDQRSKILYTNPVRLENEIINMFLFAIQDKTGNRTDITNENKKDLVGSINPAIINGLAKEFIKVCGVDFSD